MRFFSRSVSSNSQPIAYRLLLIAPVPMPHNQLIIDRAREIYLKHGGTDHRAIELEMRAGGCLSFTRRVLHSQKTRSGRIRKGWIERFGWKEQLDAGSPRHLACMSAKHEQPTAETLESREEDGMVRPRSDETSPSPSVGNARAKEKTSLPPRLGVPAVKTDQPTANRRHSRPSSSASLPR